MAVSLRTTPVRAGGLAQPLPELPGEVGRVVEAEARRDGLEGVARLPEEDLGLRQTAYDPIRPGGSTPLARDERPQARAGHPEGAGQSGERAGPRRVRV
jgi:hypothetical protein